MIRSYIFSIILLLVNFSVFTQYQHKEPLPVVRVDFNITTNDGIILDCTKYIPSGAPPMGGWPVIILCHGYGLDKNEMLDEAESFASYGYYAMTYSMRGQGNSGGVSYLISTTEMNDLLKVIQYVKNDNNTNDNRIGIKGGSQGGIIPFMAGCNGANVRTIISDMASPEFASNWIENNSIKMTLLWTLSYGTDIVRYSTSVRKYRDWILSSQRDKWDSLKTFLPVNRDFLNKLGQFQGSLLAECTWQDKFFTPLGMIKAAYILPYNNYKMYFGAMEGHGSDPSESEFTYLEQVLGDWYDYWLLDVNNNIMNSANKFVYSSTTLPIQDEGWSFSREYSPAWPPGANYRFKLYLHPGNKLRNYINISGPDTVSFFNDIKDTNLTMLEAVNREFTGNEFAAKFGKTTLMFDTDPLTQDLKMAGTPVLSLHYMSNAVICQYNFQLWEVFSNNSSKLVTRINYTNRNNSPNTIQGAYVDGIPHGHIFKQGSRIRVVVTNLDNLTDDSFLRTNPHVLPVLKRAKNIIYISPGLATYIDLPLQNIPIAIKGIANELPGEFRLYQNYPNPFNPLTKIEYDLPKASYVVINVYDISGKLIAELVNRMQVAGHYQSEWNVNNTSSGVYFIRMVADNYFDTKKAIVIK